jgi:putative Mg2+ transporter-C (MgtC) family protein
MNFSSYIAPEFVPFAQITIALIFGMILGIERVLAGRTAGPRTYGLVSLGSCLVTIMTIYTSRFYSVTVDPMPMMAAILTGVGFIGAGLIVFHESRLSGLTTAAGIWVSAIIGIAVGYQLYFIALFTTFLTLFVFTIMWRAELVIKHFFIPNLPEEHPDNE